MLSLALLEVLFFIGIALILIGTFWEDVGFNRIFEDKNAVR